MSFLVAIEGLDGAGKHTTTVYVQKALIDKGIDVNTGSFPRYGKTVASKNISAYLRGDYGAPHSIHPALAGNLFIDERIESLEWIDAKIHSSQITLFDRYSPSNIAYQAAKLQHTEAKAIARELIYKEHVLNNVPRSDIIIYLKWPVESCVKRITSRALSQGRAIDTIEADVQYLRSVAKIYEDEGFWHDVYRSKYITVDCTNNGVDCTVEEVGNKVLDIITRMYTQKIN